MTHIGILAADARDREEIAGLLGELGHEAAPSGRLAEAVESARERRPRAFVVVDDGEADGELAARELASAFPLLPVLVALKTRDANRAVALMRAGVVEVLAPPWTKEELKTCVSKSLRGAGTALAARRPPARPRSAAWYVLIVGVFLAAALGTASLRRAAERRALEAARVDRWLLPDRHPAGLAFDGVNLWVVDWFTQSLYAHAREDAKVVALRHMTSETPVAAVFTDDVLWTASADGSVARRMKDVRLTVLERFPRAAPNAAGLAFDGLYLWTLDQRARTLSKRLPDGELSVLASYRVPGLKPVALVWDGAALWTLDAGDRLLRRHNLERPEEIVAALPLPEYGDGAYAPTGLAWDGKRFWTVAAPRDGKSAALLVRHREEPR